MFLKKNLYSQDSPHALKWQFKFGIIKAKMGWIFRDRGSIMKKLEEVFFLHAQC